MSSVRIVGRWMLALGAAGAIGGGALKGPPATADIQREALADMTVPSAWKGTGGPVQPVADQWLVSFNDPVLSALVDEAVAHNADLRIAAARVEQAAGYVKLAGATLYPAIGVIAHGGGKSGGDGGLQGIWLNASLELDIWGRLRYGQAAAQAQFASVDADYAYARQSIAAGVAKSYFLAVEASLQRSIALESLRASDEILRLVGERLRIGVGDEQAVAEARADVGGYPGTLRAGGNLPRPGA